MGLGIKGSSSESMTCTAKFATEFFTKKLETSDWTDIVFSPEFTKDERAIIHK
jgi:hypothetical protein